MSGEPGLTRLESNGSSYAGFKAHHPATYDTNTKALESLLNVNRSQSISYSYQNGQSSSRRWWSAAKSCFQVCTRPLNFASRNIRYRWAYNLFCLMLGFTLMTYLVVSTVETSTKRRRSYASIALSAQQSICDTIEKSFSSALETQEPAALRERLAKASHHLDHLKKERTRFETDVDPVHTRARFEQDLEDNDETNQTSYLKRRQLARKPWTIIAFSDIKYAPIARIWYNQLAELGYTEHRIGALDRQTYDVLKADSYRVILTNEKLPVTKFLRTIWKVRIVTILKLLEEGFNVFVSDVDSIWVKYRDLTSLPEMIDTFHSYGTTYPQNVFAKWRFVVCGCVGGYHSNANTVRFFKRLKERCENTCDDQHSMNNLLMRDYNMTWAIPPGMKNRFGQSNVDGLSLTSLMFNNEEVSRGRHLDCKASWIISPKAKKESTNKYARFMEYKQCFEPGVLPDHEPEDIPKSNAIIDTRDVKP